MQVAVGRVWRGALARSMGRRLAKQRREAVMQERLREQGERDAMRAEERRMQAFVKEEARALQVRRVCVCACVRASFPLRACQWLADVM